MLATFLGGSALIIVVAALPTAAADHIALHEGTLEKVKTIDAQLSSVLVQSDGTRVDLSDIVWRREGKREYYSETTYIAFGSAPDGEPQMQVLEQPSRRVYGYDAETLRVLENWDPSEAPNLPLRPGGANANLFASVKAAILPRDPRASYRSAPFWLQLVVTPTHSLSELAATADVGEPQTGEDGKIKLSFTTEDQGVVVCYLDPAHGGLISRTEFFKDRRAERPLTTIRILEFKEIGNSSLSFPVHAIMEREGGDDLEIRATDVRVNHPLAEADITLEFPEGARVDEPVRGLTHVWGNGKPEHTFTNFDDFSRWESAAAGSHSVQGGEIVPRTNGVTGIRRWLVASNIGILVIIGILLYLRHRLGSRREGMPGR